MIDVAQDAPTTVILAEDAASLYLQATMMWVWASRGQSPVVAADPGRDQTCFYGTLNLHTGTESVSPWATRNAEASARHLEQILATHPDVPLLLWECAAWHWGAPIRAVLAAHPRLEIMQFPVAVPELNPQEHGWKAVREAVSHNHAEAPVATLAARFTAHLTDTPFPTSFLEHRGFYTVHPKSI